MLPRPPRRGLVPWRTLRKLQISGFRNQVVSERREVASRLSMFSRLCRVRCGQGFLNASSGLLGAGLPRLAATNFSRPKPVFESRSRFRQVSYAVTDQQYPATSTRLKHAAERSLKHPEHDHVKREPGRPSPDQRKLQNNFRTGAVEQREEADHRYPILQRETGDFGTLAPGSAATTAGRVPATARDPAGSQRTPDRPDAGRTARAPSLPRRGRRPRSRGTQLRRSSNPTTPPPGLGPARLP